MPGSILDNVNLPAQKEIEVALRVQRELATFLSTKCETQKISIQDANDETHQIELPTSALTLLMKILGGLAVGNAVQVVPVHARSCQHFECFTSPYGETFGGRKAAIP